MQESLGDSGEAIGRILKRAKAHGRVFEPDMIKKINLMMDTVERAYTAMNANLKVPYHQLKDISNAQNAEYRINDCRNVLREEHIANLENSEYNYQTGVYYIDIVSELEKMGDFIINISEAIVDENNA